MDCTFRVPGACHQHKDGIGCTQNKPCKFQQTNTIKESLDGIARKFGVLPDNPSESEYSYTFSQVPAGLGIILMDEIHAVLKTQMPDHRIISHPAGGTLTVEWED